MFPSHDRGLELDPSDLVDEVKKSYYSEFKELFSQGDAEFILNMLGEDISNKIRKHDLSKLNVPANTSNAPKANESKSPETPKKGYMTQDEYREWLNSRIKD